MPDPAADPSQASPAVLRAAAAIAVVQGAVTAVLGVVEAFAVDGDRVVVGVTTAVFFAAYGLLLVVSGVALWRPRTWARGPVLAAQLVWLGVAYSLHSGSATWLAVVLAVSAVLCLAALLHPASIRAIEENRPAD
ncbi:hypothetical protein GCM10011519_13630 [Marmoricola endophyticus]|uniref:Integral membrane protein n=1 Tax=Marmoricola endophyticus TaxID=2040280 RepID=A0A917BF73_9ACTN|nr:hypothetical protein [Marmoricola endophyticus]GGF41144.1 hypothetical protein GCM10011519_13630 [Marmoricola endophyticus]